MKIAFFELEGWESPRIAEALGEHDILSSQDKIDPLSLPPAGACRDVEALSVFVNSRITPEVLDLFPKLRLIATRSTGYDHIDLAECARRNIAVAYVPGYGDNTVAEFAFGLLLNLTRRIYWGIEQIRRTGSFSVRDLRGYDLKDKTLGIVGTGRIGREMIRMAKGFGLKIVAFDPFPDPQFAHQEGFHYGTLEDLLKSSDIISLHCPLNESTRHLIHSGNIGLVKRGAYLVNTARGGIVETGALVEALQSGILRGAALDVLEEEGETKEELKLLGAHPKEEELRTILENHILMKMPNVLITPHNAFNSQEALERILAATLSNMQRFLAGRPANLIAE